MKRWWVVLSGWALAVSAIVPAQGAIGAEPPHSGAAAAEASPLKRLPRVVTLVTGDRVVLTADGNGADTFSFVPAPGRPAHGYVSSRIDGRLHVVPRDVAALVPRTLDPALFDVTTLLQEQGDDAARADVRVIWRQGPRTPRTRMPDQTRGRRPLHSIRAESARVPKADAPAFGAALVAARRDAGELPAKVWLDRRTRRVLDPNLTQVGAPQVWAAGADGRGTKIAVLDTGVDSNHPDLAGKVVASENFSFAPDGLDRNGHGTHVASIAAGSGAASGGARRGIAHAADILSAKVLADDGFGFLSDAAIGAEWAVAQGADVVNMSLASDGQSDGTDPLSQTIDSLTARSGALFVVAAGNHGQPRTIATPAAAAEALTVGAVDVDDTYAGFSSRGPRLGGGIKPEITAPGVGISAALSTDAGGTADQRYIPLSGTSMATPHVAGGAALLTQLHPTWTPARLKAAMVATAKEQADATVHEEGGGRLALPEATAATVLPGTAALDFGLLPFPQTGAPITRELTWTNTGSASATLDLSLRSALPAGAVTLNPSTLTVAAGATGRATVTLQAGDRDSGLAAGLHGGEIVAVGGGTEMGTPFAFEKEPPTYDVRLKMLDVDGEPAPYAFATMLNAEDHLAFNLMTFADETGTVSVRVPPGTYHAEAFIDAFDDDNVASDARWVVRPEFQVQAATEVVLDARTVATAHISVAGSETVRSYQTIVEQRTDTRGNVAQFSSGAYGPLNTVGSAPTPPVTVGKLDTYLAARVSAPMVRFAGVAGAPIPVEQSATVTIDRRLPVVDVGDGTQAAFAAAAARGAIALVSRRGHSPTAVMVSADNAGAALVVFANDVDKPWQTYLEAPSVTPAVTVPSSTGTALLAARSAHVRSSAVADPVYDVAYMSAGRFPSSNTHTLTSTDVRQMSRVQTAVAGMPGATGLPSHGLGRTPVFDGMSAVALPFASIASGVRRTEYVLPGKWYAQGYRVDDSAFSLLDSTVREEAAGATRAETWFGAPWRPLSRQVGSSGEAPAAFRDDSALFVGLPPLADADRHVETSASFGPVTSTYALRRDGKFVGTSSGPYGMIELAGGAANLELQYDVDASGVLPSQTKSRTLWKFRSDSPASNSVPVPLLEVDAQLPVNLSGKLTGDAATVRVSRPFGAAVNLQRLTVQVSTNGGTTWRSARTTSIGPTSASVTLPALSSGGTVSVRVEATTADGQSVTQTLFAAATAP